MGHDCFRVNPKNIQAMKDWTHPKILKSLRGFLGVTGYCMKFVRNYGKILGPLTRLLKKKSFSWDDPAEQAFISLNNSMCLTPVLAIPDFNKPLPGTGLGAVLT